MMDDNCRTNWLCYLPCAQCLTPDNCETCQHQDQPVLLYRVISATRPLRAVNGPAKDADELLGILAKFFEFREDGRLYLRPDMLNKRSEQ